MKKYIGTKTIEAEPMTKGDADRANLLRNCPEPSEQNDPGYHVRCEDGYESWSPKDVFDKAYKVADTFKDRLVIEKDELVNRHCKLGDFISGENFEKVVPDGEQRSLLCMQYKAMGEYLMILKERIETIAN